MNKIKALTFSGIVCAMSVSVALLSNIVSVTKFIGPLFIGFLLIIVREYYGLSTGIITFVATSILLFILAPSKLSAYSYVVLLGYYPMIRQDFDKIKSVLLRVFVKTVLFESVGGLSLFLALRLSTNFSGKENLKLLIFGIVVLFNIAVVIYDLVIYGFKKYFDIELKDRLNNIFK